MNVLVLQCEVAKYDALQQTSDDPIETTVDYNVKFLFYV